MPFRLINTLALCQRLVNNTLHKYLDIFVVAYLDDILIFSKTKAKYTEHVRKVLAKLATVPLLLEPEKYKFSKKELEFLGFIIRKNRIWIDQKKINTVLT
jgi:hypothetical protein